MNVTQTYVLICEMFRRTAGPHHHYDAAALLTSRANSLNIQMMSS